jgi:hypothetical protein
MAFFHSTNIPSSGLVSCIDKANTYVDQVATTELGTSGTEALTYPQYYYPRQTCRNIEANYQPSLNPAMGAGMSMFIWLKRTSTTTGGWDPVWLWDDGGPAGRTVWFGGYFNQTWQIHCSLPYFAGTDNPAYWSVDPTWADAGISNPQIGTWYLVGFTYTNSTQIARAYINGVEAASGTRPGAPGLNRTINANYPIQMFSANGDYANFKSDAFWMWNRPLSGAEVLQTFNARKTRYGY